MESKLPKPSGIKRPVVKTIIPQSRIKASALPSSKLSTTEPFKNLINVQSVRARTRAVSPDIRSYVPKNRINLRRSRSVSDLNALRSIAGVHPDSRNAMSRDNVFKNIGGIHTDSRPAKVPRFVQSESMSAKVPRLVQPDCAAKPPHTLSTATGSVKTSIKAATKQVAPINKKACSVTSTSTTGAGKPINKRIPPYDFKARYNDLLEKFKTLKEKYDSKCGEMEVLENMPEQLQQCQLNLEVTKSELEKKSEEVEQLIVENQSLNSRLDSITKSLTKSRSELETLTASHQILLTQHSDICSEVSELRKTNKHLTEQNSQMQEDLTILKEQVFHSNMERKELHNALMDLRGNIRVFCRVRPPLECEQDKALCGWNYMDEATVEVINHDLLSKNKPGVHTFNFDYVFHPGCRQQDVFEMVAPLIQSAMDGYNVCIFAYGQTGSGKTFTMDGVESNTGVIPRTVDLIFESVQNYKRLGWDYKIKVTFLEIYNEVLYDLLSNEQKEMEIRMAKHNKNEIYVSNITEATVIEAEQLRELMKIAKMNRATAATIGNERSSRSHAVTRIELIGYHAGKNETSIGTINLVDLAGSESPKTSIRMAETKNINRSLSELTNVILALLQKQDHIPYRNSKLTHLLMPSLGGNSKTLMFINVSPLLECYVESVKSLRFAASVNSCKIAKAKRNRFLNTRSASGSFDK